MAGNREYRIRRAEREVSPAFTLNQVARLALVRAGADERTGMRDLLTAQLMAALTLEAVLNDVGVRAFVERRAEREIWNAVERLRPRQKLDAICERIGLKPDFGSLPFQDFGPIFVFRNELAHAKTMQLVTCDIPPEALDEERWLNPDLVPDLKAGWEKTCTLNTAKRWRKSVSGMSEALCEAADCIDPVLVGDGGSWSGEWTLVDGEESG